MSLIIDLRCLQDANYYERGIGNHARNIIRHAPGRFVGLIDPALPPLPPEMAALVPEVSPHAYIPGASVLLNPSPMSPDQNFLARLLTNPAVLKAACVHDFIPYDDQPHYLTHPINRLDYFSAMAWLKHYDVFLPNSVPTETRLRELYGNVRGAVTGVALPPWVLGVKPVAPRHILMIGGDDWRKNPEVLAAAHGGSQALRRIPLIITGHVSPALAARLQALTEVELPGRLSNEQMRDLYAGALAVVTPSRAEGFSLPVLEACAAGVPSIASDIPAHRALLPRGPFFGPEDARELARVLEDTLARRGEIIAAQAGLWREFSEANVAAKVFAALAPKPAVARGAKPRIAMLTPMPPEKSGIADYSAATVAALRLHARVDVFSGNAISALAYAGSQFDAVLSVIGNSPLHAEIYDLSLRWGSAVLCHDARLLGLATGRGLAHAARMAGAELGRSVSDAEILAWAEDETKREASFLGEMARAARPLIFHSQQPVALVRARFSVAARYLPFALQRQFGALDRQGARAALGISQDETLIVSFGFITRGKGIPAALKAFAKLRARMDCRLVFAGEATEYAANFLALAEELGIAPFVRLGTGFLTEAAYRAWMAAADAALQLREGPPGNISGTLQDAISAGLPAVASHDLAANLAAPAYVKRVGSNPDEIAAALAEILRTRPDTAAARAAYCTAHGMDRYATALLAMLLT
jgi:glycosyltransferase involved in cell wall biosynthesis